MSDETKCPFEQRLKKAEAYAERLERHIETSGVILEKNETRIDELESAIRRLTDEVDWCDGLRQTDPMHVRHKHLQAGHAALLLERNDLLRKLAVCQRKLRKDAVVGVGHVAIVMTREDAERHAREPWSDVHEECKRALEAYDDTTKDRRQQ